MSAPIAPIPTVPQGWQATWSDQYSQWFYVNQATGASQWESPSGPLYGGQPPETPPSSHYNPAQPKYLQQGYFPPPSTTQPETSASKGIMGKLSNLGPKAQTALAASGGLAAGAFLEHEYDEHSGRLHHAEEHHHFGTMTSLIGAAGAGALGAKLFGRKGHSPQAAPAPQPYYAPQPGAPVYSAPPPRYPPQSPPLANYPAQPPSFGPPSPGPGFGGVGNMAMGGISGAAGAQAMGESSNLLPHYQSQGQISSMPGSSGRNDSFLGGVPHSGPRLNILAAAYADKDVTARVRSLVTAEQTLTIEKMGDELGDPWPEAKRKSFSVLYRYGDRPLEVLAGSTEDGIIDVRHEALANARMAFINKDPGRIVCLIWGSQSVLSKERVEKLERDGDMDCSGLGDGGFWAWEPRSLICYYRAAHGGVEVGHGREGGTLRLPWNPLSKWS